MAGEQGRAGEEGEGGIPARVTTPDLTPLCAGSSSLQPAAPPWPQSVSTVGSDTRWGWAGVRGGKARGEAGVLAVLIPAYLVPVCP